MMRLRFTAPRVVSMVVGAALVAATLASPAGADVDRNDRTSDAGARTAFIVNGASDLTTAVLRLGAGAGVEVERVIDALDVVSFSLPTALAAEVSTKLVESGLADSIEPVQRVRSFATPNDPDYSRQTWMAADGFASAWDRTTGSSTVVVAVLDTGVNDLDDFAGRVRTGINLATDSPSSGRNADGSQYRHGTVAAEIIGATGNNGIGIAGACWSCQILPVKVLDDNGDGTIDDVVDGIRWAVDNGANIINMSLGADADSTALKSAVDYAVQRGVVVVAAAGNDFDVAGSAARYPAAYSNVIGVGAYHQRSAGPVYYSQRGSSWYEIAAGHCRDSRLSDGQCGTSFSAPEVTGAVALMKSAAPTATAAQLTSALFDSADQVSGFTAPNFRYGLLNAGAAVTLVMNRVPPPTITVTTTTTAPPPVVVADTTAPAVSMVAPAAYNSGVITVSASVSDAGGVAALSATVDGRQVYASGPVGNGAFSFSFDTRSFGDGQHVLRIEATDAANNRGATEHGFGVDNNNPVALLYSPGNTSTVRKQLKIGAYTQDASGIMGTFIVVNNQVVYGWVGGGFGNVTVPIRRNGNYSIVAITVDNAGRISGSNWVHVKGRTR